MERRVFTTSTIAQYPPFQLQPTQAYIPSYTAQVPSPSVSQSVTTQPYGYSSGYPSYVQPSQTMVSIEEWNALQRRVDTLNKENVQLRNERNQQAQRIHFLEEKLNELKNEAQIFQAQSNKQLQDLLHELNHIKNQNLQLQQMTPTEKIIEKRVEVPVEKIVEVPVEKGVDISQLENEISSLKERIEILEKENLAGLETEDNYRRQNRELHAKLERLRRELSDTRLTLQTQLNARGTKLAHVEQQLTELAKLLENKRKEAEEWKNCYLESRKTISQLSELQANYETLKVQYERANKLASEYEEKYTAALQELKTLNVQNERLCERVAEETSKLLREHNLRNSLEVELQERLKQEVKAQQNQPEELKQESPRVEPKFEPAEMLTEKKIEQDQTKMLEPPRPSIIH